MSFFLINLIIAIATASAVVYIRFSSRKKGSEPQDIELQASDFEILEI